MDPSVLGVTMIGVGVIVWLMDRYAPPRQGPTRTNANLESGISETIEAAKKLPFPTLLVVFGFILVLLDNDWIMFSAGS